MFLKIYFYQTMQIGFVFFLKIFQDKCKRDCNRDYFQCNRLRFCLFVTVIEQVAIIVIGCICAVIAPCLLQGWAINGSGSL